MIEKWYTANQPQIFPAIYMMARYARVDAYVSMNNAQVTKSGHQYRVSMVDRNGKEVMIIISLKARTYKLINEVEVADIGKDVRGILLTLQSLYGKQENYRVLKEELTELLMSLETLEKPITLAKINKEMFKWLVDKIGLDMEMYDSEIIVPERAEHPSEWVAQMGAAINCNIYLGGEVAQKAYLRESDFIERGMRFESQNYVMTPYKRGKYEFSDASVSCLDPLFYGGVELVRKLIGLDE